MAIRTIKDYINNKSNIRNLILKVRRIRDRAITGIKKEDLLNAVREIKLNNSENEPNTIGEGIKEEEKKGLSPLTEEEIKELSEITKKADLKEEELKRVKSLIEIANKELRGKE